MKSKIKTILIVLNLFSLLVFALFSGPACTYSETQYDINYEHSASAKEGQVGIYVDEVPAMFGGGEFLEINPVEIKTIYENNSAEVGWLDQDTDNTEILPLNKILLEVDFDLNNKFVKDKVIMYYNPKDNSLIKRYRIRHIFEDGSIMVDDDIDRESNATMTYEYIDGTNVESFEAPIIDDHIDEKYFSLQELEYFYPETENSNYTIGEKVLYYIPCDSDFEDCPGVEIISDDKRFEIAGFFGDFILLESDILDPIVVNKNTNLIRETN